jgi:hypothetical protein
MWHTDGFFGEDHLTGVYSHRVYFGTDPNPPSTALQFLQDPGPLEPNTTYYWRVTGFTDNLPYEGPLWSFTTAGPLRAEASTWGRVKALYRH